MDPAAPEPIVPEVPEQGSGSSPAPSEPSIEKYFRAMIRMGASDLHIKPGTTPHLRVNTRIIATKGQPMTAGQTAELGYGLMSAVQREQYERHGSLDVAYEIEGSDRFRINVFRQRGSMAIAVRRVSRDIADFRALNLPACLDKIAEERQGLVLLSGPTGSGKSTSIAAMIEHINQTRQCHILTIEDPIEYLYESKKSLISQREIGIDVDDFGQALKYLMREDPDVVLIGEMRDRETFSAALQAAETGHLVFGTIHASTASQTIGRILDLFPADSRALVRQNLAFNLKAIICQKLLPCVAPNISRIPAVEILLANPIVRQLILEERDNEIPEALRSHERDGMQGFNRSLMDLIEKNLIDPKIAYEVAPNADELKMMIKGISAGRSGLLSR